MTRLPSQPSRVRQGLCNVAEAADGHRDQPEPRVTVLDNGFRIVTHGMPHLKTSSVGVWIGAGAGHESIEQHGISHLLEHMAFKGTTSRSARRIAEDIENVGGDLNACTSQETTGYYARVLEGDEALAIDILADILLRSQFDDDELKREKDVILHEIAASQDSPDDLAYDFFQAIAYPDHALGRSILGTPDSVAAIRADDLRSYLADRYRPGRMVLSAAGAVDHDRIVEAGEAAFGGLPPGEATADLRPRFVGGIQATAKPFEQSHLLIGYDGPAYGGPDFFTAQVFTGLFGGGMSSRLFQEAREARGLCYSIYATGWGLSESGLFAMHAATAPEMIAPLCDVMAEMLEDVGANGPNLDETARAKAQLKSGLLMSLESTFARAEQMARHLLAHNRLIGTEELVAKVDAVTPEAVGALAAKMAAGPPGVVVVGSGAVAEAQAKAAYDVMRRLSD